MYGTKGGFNEVTLSQNNCFFPPLDANFDTKLASKYLRLDTLFPAKTEIVHDRNGRNLHYSVLFDANPQFHRISRIPRIAWYQGYFGGFHTFSGQNASTLDDYW